MFSYLEWEAFMSEDNPELSHQPEDWFASLDDVKRWSKDDPGDFIAAIMHEIAGCRVVIEGYSKFIFEYGDLTALDEKGIDAQGSIQRSLARLEHLLNFMHEYRKTLRS